VWKRWFRRLDPAPALAELDEALRDILAGEPGIRLLES